MKKAHKLENLTACTIIVPPKNWLKQYLARFTKAKNKIEIGVSISGKRYKFTRKKFVKIIEENGTKY